MPTVSIPLNKKKSLRLALVGYGKMGKAVEEIAVSAGHTISLKINSRNASQFSMANLQQCDVAIEFTGPETAFQNIIACIDAGIPVISGSTGWLDHREEVEQHCISRDGAFLYASNFSIGVNIFFEINRKLAALMRNRQEYDVSLEEIHHTQKKDAPSGTAISLAEDIIKNISWKSNWENIASGTKELLTITSKRTDPVPGTHKVRYISGADEIEIIHTALNRKGFAEGAVMAAEFIAGKKGIFTMQDVLDMR